MRITRFISVLLILGIMSSFMVSCDSDEAADTSKEAEKEIDEAEKDAYDAYIKQALDSIDKNADGQPTPTPSASDGKAVEVDKTAPNDYYVSSMENPVDSYDPFAKPTVDTPTPTPDLSPSPTVDPNATPTPTPTPYITPEEFDVGKCCIYINGESDNAYGTEIITAINKARTDLGYDPLITNKGLTTCADRRTREIAASFSHTRPNGQPFYSLAPDHFKAEMLVINNQKAEEAVDVMIKNDPISRNLIFTTKYKSIGASSFKCNGMKYTVVSFGL